MNESADYRHVLVGSRGGAADAQGARRCAGSGFVTTNSISQVFQRRIIERHLTAKNPIGIVFAVPDHPWTQGDAG